jgi:hypothetical protein
MKLRSHGVACVIDDWQELEGLVEELRSAREESWQRAEQLRQQMSSLQPHLEIIARQYEDLGVAAHLGRLNEKLLAGMGSVEVIESGLGFERVAALVWPAQIDPRDRDGSESDGYFRIEIWMGPGFQDGRPRVRIAGAKRLEATLPTNAERFRSALLMAFRDPQFVERPDLKKEGEESSDSEESIAAPEESASEPTEPDLMDS